MVGKEWGGWTVEAKTEVAQAAAVGVGSVAMWAGETTAGAAEAEVAMEAKGVARDPDIHTSMRM